MAQTAVIPAWAATGAQAVADCHWIAHAAGDQQVCAVLDWVADEQPNEAQAVELLGVAEGDAQITVAWLLGMGRPPVRLPRRNPDGDVVTEQQLYDEYIAGTSGLPEQRREAEDRARRDAALYRRLAALVPDH